MTNIVSDFLQAAFAPNKMQAAITQLREENARLRHELRHYAEYHQQVLIEPRLKSNPDYMHAIQHSCWQKIAGALAESGLFRAEIVPLSHPERSPYDMPGEATEKLVMRVLVRMPEPILQGVPVPCEEDPDWVIEEYALQIRAKPADFKRPFIRIALPKRLTYETSLRNGDTEEILTRVAVVRFERDGTPYVVSR